MIYITTLDADRLAELMAEKSFDVSELARRSGVHRFTLSPFLRGQTNPSRRTIRAIADALGVETSEITHVTMKDAV